MSATEGANAPATLGRVWADVETQFAAVRAIVGDLLAAGASVHEFGVRNGRVCIATGDRNAAAAVAAAWQLRPLVWDRTEATPTPKWWVSRITDGCDLDISLIFEKAVA